MPPSGRSFTDLGLQKWAVDTLAELSIETPTAVQDKCIPLVLGGKDVCGTACTGSGKTAAYALPILQALCADPYGVFAVVVAPTREIAVQVTDQFKVLGGSFSVDVLTLIGGVENHPQQKVLERRPPIVVATPGRLLDTLKVPHVVNGFRKLRYLVLDEADRLLDESFQETMDGIFKILRRCNPTRYQLLLFSATLSSLSLDQHDVLKRIGWDKRGYEVVDTGETEEGIYTSATGLTEAYISVPDKVKLATLAEVLDCTAEKGQEEKENPFDFTWKSAIVFCASCQECEVVRLTLQELGLPVVSINSLLEQKQRTESLSMFKMGKGRILIATDVASRGLDIPHVDLVVNYDLPKLTKTYVHRAGRTARAGRTGCCLSVCERSDLRTIKKFESHVGKKFKKWSYNEDAVLDTLEVVVAARTRAKMSVNQRFGEMLREREESKVRRNIQSEVTEEKESHKTKRNSNKRSRSERRARRGGAGDGAPANTPAKDNNNAPAKDTPAKKKRKIAKKPSA